MTRIYLRAQYICWVPPLNTFSTIYWNSEAIIFYWLFCVPQFRTSEPTDGFFTIFKTNINPLKPELNPIFYLLALLGAHHFLHVSRIRVKLLFFRRLMSYIYGAPILDVSRSHTTTQHIR